ncbi:MAG: hypothetical protein AAGF60_14815 [Pseudomonadota bacterium]
MRSLPALLIALRRWRGPTPPLREAADGVLEPLSSLKRTPTQTHTAPAPSLSIPCPDPTGEEVRRDRYQSQGQRYARQEDWTALSAAMRQADQSRDKTPGGMPVAELLSFGARADVVGAAEHALLGGRPGPGADLLAGISQLEEVLCCAHGDAMIAATVAQAHVDLGWAWRGTGYEAEVPSRNRAAFAAHFDRASEILADLPRANSPLVEGVRCAACARATPDVDRIAAAFEALITLDPTTPQSFRAMGLRLLPRWSGASGALELHARRMAARTQTTWGAGGYTWTMLDAIAADDAACAALDVEFFIDGLRDILARCPDQHVVNLLAAYCANTMGMQMDGSDEAALVRAQIADCAGWIVREWLTELHPMIWAHAARGFDQALRVRCAERFAAAGLADAHRFIAQLFRREIDAGKRIIFTEDGPEAVPA